MEKIQNILIGVTGSSSAINIPYYCSVLLEEYTKEIDIILTKNAEHFITPLAIKVITKKNIWSYEDDYNYEGEDKIPHIHLARKPEFILVLPATANFIGKAANGICDDLLTTTIMATTKDVVIVPSMNPTMWSNEILQKNIKQLESIARFHIIPPVQNVTASGERGVGAMPDVFHLIESLGRIFYDA